MSDTTFRPATVEEILLAMKARVLSVLGLSSSQVHITACDPQDVPHYLGDQDVVLRLGKESSAQGDSVDGGGRYANLRRRHVDIYPRTRLWLDPSDSDSSRLTDSTYGHLQLERGLVNALLEYTLADEEGNDLTGPLWLADELDAPKRDKNDPAWVSSKIDCRFDYIRLLSLPEASAL